MTIRDRIVNWLLPGGRVREDNGAALALMRERESLRAELREASQMFGSGPWAGPTLALQEGIADLELALEDRGWQSLSISGVMEFSRSGIRQIILMTRLYRIKNPLILRGIAVSGAYVFGRGFTVSSKDEREDEVLKDFWTGSRNQSVFGGGAVLDLDAALYTDGNVFFALFVDGEGLTTARTIDPLEIVDIVCDAEDYSKPLYYVRKWNGGGDTTEIMEAAYLAPGVDQGIQTKAPIARTVTGNPVRMIHRKDGALARWKFGCPKAYPALDWARSYKQRLEDYATIVRNLARFSLDVETKGGAPALAGYKQGLVTTLGNDGTSWEDNPSPTVGAALIHGPGSKIKAFDGAGKTPPPEEGRRLAHMVYMTFGLPETFFSDVSVGTLATATSLDRPTELKFISDQERWRDTFMELSRFVLDAAAEKGLVTGGEYQVSVTFPPILEGDIGSEVEAVVKAMTLGGQKVRGIDEREGVRLLLRLVGVEDTETVLEAMYPNYDAAREGEDEVIDGEPPPAKAEVVERAIRELRRSRGR